MACFPILVKITVLQISFSSTHQRVSSNDHVGCFYDHLLQKSTANYFLNWARNWAVFGLKVKKSDLMRFYSIFHIPSKNSPIPGPIRKIVHRTFFVAKGHRNNQRGHLDSFFNQWKKKECATL